MNICILKTFLHYHNYLKHEKKNLNTYRRFSFDPCELQYIRGLLIPPSSFWVCLQLQTWQHAPNCLGNHYRLSKASSLGDSIDGFITAAFFWSIWHWLSSGALSRLQREPTKDNTCFHKLHPIHSPACNPTICRQGTQYLPRLSPKKYSEGTMANIKPCKPTWQFGHPWHPLAFLHCHFQSTSTWTVWEQTIFSSSSFWKA